MFNKTPHTKGFKNATSNKKMITEEEIEKLFPRGYRECDFFSSPVELWAMSKEEACLKSKSTALISSNLNDNIDLPKNLQESFYIGHSSDTKLFTYLLNDKNLKTETPHNNTSTNHEENAANNDLVKNISINKTCYTCSNVCKCSGLLSNRLKNPLSKNYRNTNALLSKEQLVVPEIQSINEFDKFSIKSLPNYILNNKDLTVTYIPKPNTSENRCDMMENGSDSEGQQILHDNIALLQNTPNIQSSPLDYRVVGRDFQDETIINENNEYYEDVLKYFHLKCISDIF